jgi:two-component system cell cycle response regulator DivK
MSKILIVEDNDQHIDLLRRVLVAGGHEVLPAHNAKTGLQMAQDHRPDIILLDLDLPDVDGQVLLGQMRRVLELTKTPIVAVTAWPAGATPEMIEEHGFDGYISKPVKLSTLCDQITAYLERNEPSQKL